MEVIFFNDFDIYVIIIHKLHPKLPLILAKYRFKSILKNNKLSELPLWLLSFSEQPIIAQWIIAYLQYRTCISDESRQMF